MDQSIRELHHAPLYPSFLTHCALEKAMLVSDVISSL